MKVVLFGASGMVGSRILQELVDRGHDVTAVVRTPEKITAAGVRALEGDVTEESTVASTIKGAYALITASARTRRRRGMKKRLSKRPSR